MSNRFIPTFEDIWAGIAVWFLRLTYSHNDDAGGRVVWQKQGYEPYESGMPGKDVLCSSRRSSLSAASVDSSVTGMYNGLQIKAALTKCRNGNRSMKPALIQL